MSKHGIDKTNQRKNSRVQHDMMVNHRRNDKAYERFKRESYYQSQALVKAQGEQMERNDVLGYMDKLGHDVKGEMLIEKEDS